MTSYNFQSADFLVIGTLMTIMAVCCVKKQSAIPSFRYRFVLLMGMESFNSLMTKSASRSFSAALSLCPETRRVGKCRYTAGRYTLQVTLLELGTSDLLDPDDSKTGGLVSSLTLGVG